MPETITHSNHYKYQRDRGLIDLAADSLLVILLNTTFAFNAASHATLADVTADQLATGNGYTQDNKAITGQVLTEDDTLGRSFLAVDFITFMASGGTIGPTGAAVIYDDTTSDKTVVACIDFGTDITVADGQSLQFRNLVIESV